MEPIKEWSLSSSGLTEDSHGWVDVALEPDLAQSLCMAECIEIFRVFGEVASVDMSRCRTHSVVSVRYFKEHDARQLTHQLYHKLWRPTKPKIVEDPPCQGGYVRGSRQERDHLEVNELHIQSGQERRRTVMVGQIPRNCGAVQFLEGVRSIGLLTRLCFFYMPMDRARRRHCGYAFLEFNDHMDVLVFYQSLSRLGEILSGPAQERPIHVHYARIQGWRTFTRTMTNDLNFIYEPNANVRPQLFLPPYRSDAHASFYDLLPTQVRFHL